MALYELSGIHCTYSRYYLAQQILLDPVVSGVFN